MTEFKIGDKVKIIENTNGSANNIGDVAVITEVDSLRYVVRVKVQGGKKWDNWSRMNEIELYEEPKDAPSNLYDPTELARIAMAYGIVITVQAGDITVTYDGT